MKCSGGWRNTFFLLFFMMKLQEIVKKIYDNLPIELVADQDNVGLIAGNYDDECEKMTVAYELNNGVLDEVLQNRSNLCGNIPHPAFPANKIFYLIQFETEVTFRSCACRRQCVCSPYST